MGGLPQIVAHGFQQVGLLGKAFGQNVAGAVQGGFGRIDLGFGIQIAFGQRQRVGILLGQNGVRQRLQAGFAGNLGTGTTLGLVMARTSLPDAAWCQPPEWLAPARASVFLLADRFQNGMTTRLHIAQIDQAHFQITQDIIVQAASRFLAVTGNKRDRGPVVQELDRRGGLLDADVQFRGQ